MEQFEELLRISRENNLVPNFTTSGYGMTRQLAEVCKQYCGAVAVSWYRSEYTLKAIELLLNADVKTNIHYVLGKNSIDEAIDRLKRNDFPRGINAVIFLLHKPAGQGTGLGMGITRDIIENKHGGSLSFDSKEGQGSCFKFIIPIRKK